MSRTYFITATGTGIGKTLVTAALVHQLRVRGQSVSALKPVISGYDEADKYSDTAQLLAAQNLSLHRPNIDAVSPWRFAAALAPNMAARMENKVIDFSEVVKFCTLPRITEYTLIEGAGGVMSPLTDSHTMLDWMAALGAPVILVVGTYLGAIGHALAAAEALKHKGLTLQAVVVSESETTSMSAVGVAKELKRFLPQANYVVPLPRIAGSEPLWQNMADLTWVLT